MGFVPFLESAQNRDRVLHGRLTDVHRLEAALEGRILLDVLAIFVERGGTNHAQFPAGEHRLEHVAGVHGAFGFPCTDDRVHLVDKHHELPFGARDLLEHGLESLFEFAAELGTGNEGAQVEREERLAFESLGDVAIHNALREPFGDSGLTHTRLADEHRVVLGAAREHLNDAADFLVASNHGIKLALAGKVGEIPGELRERLVLILRVLVGDLMGAADGLERRCELRGCRPCRLEQRDRLGALGTGERHQEVLGGDVLVA